MPSIVTALLTLALPLTTLALPSALGDGSKAPTVTVAVEATWDQSGKPCNQSYVFNFNYPLNLNGLKDVQALYLENTEGLEGKVVCKPHWTDKKGNSVVGLFLTKTTPSRLLDIAGGSEYQKGSDLRLKFHDANPDLPARAAASWLNTTTADTSSPSKTFATCDLLITMLPNGHIVRDVLLGKDDIPGFAAGLRLGTVVIDTSSSSPYHTQALGKDLAELGLVLVDSSITQT
ncbi:hypothetical protein TI39_contig1257g00001 [Zymoseptoria brevis]|uniref:6-phosphogluconate dehydrogenase NADP-binding domain-containing protein n=1 Tax=Zymoseptoria brevis TaxID=1047168 RepID=A0A0F4GE50_9PEZI|nr:hypothetical protein TI39_contig1257g00001 [Zymoseptoria brevis]